MSSSIPIPDISTSSYRIHIFSYQLCLLYLYSNLFLLYALYTHLNTILHFKKIRSLVCSSQQGARNSRLPISDGFRDGHDQQ